MEKVFCLLSKFRNCSKLLEIRSILVGRPHFDQNCSKFGQNCTKFDRSRSAGPEIRSNLLEIRLKMFEIRSILVGRLDACAEMCRTSNSSPWAVFREGRDINTSIRFRTENGLWRSWDESLTLSCLYFVQNRPSRPVP